MTLLVLAPNLPFNQPEFTLQPTPGNALPRPGALGECGVLVLVLDSDNVIALFNLTGPFLRISMFLRVLHLVASRASHGVRRLELFDGRRVVVQVLVCFD